MAESFYIKNDTQRDFLNGMLSFDEKFPVGTIVVIPDNYDKNNKEYVYKTSNTYSLNGYKEGIAYFDGIGLCPGSVERINNKDTDERKSFRIYAGLLNNGSYESISVDEYCLLRKNEIKHYIKSRRETIKFEREMIRMDRKDLNSVTRNMNKCVNKLNEKYKK